GAAGTAPAIAAPQGGARFQMAPDEEQRGLLGIYIFEDDETAGGAKIEKVKEGSPAAKAGLKPGDVVVQFKGKKVDSSAALAKQLGGKKHGDEGALPSDRDGWQREVKVKLGSKPGEKATSEKPAEKPAPKKETAAEKPKAKAEKKPGFLGVYLKDSDSGLAV